MSTNKIRRHKEYEFLITEAHHLEDCINATRRVNRELPKTNKSNPERLVVVLDLRHQCEYYVDDEKDVSFVKKQIQRLLQKAQTVRVRLYCEERVFWSNIRSR